MTSTRIIFTGAILFSILCSAGCDYRTPTDEIEYRQGDLLFRRGRGTKTRAVLAADSAGIYSHVGIVCRTDSGLVAVHAVPGEGREVVKAEWPEEFFAKERAVKGAVGRLQYDEEVLTAAAEYAMDAHRAEVEFDHDYDLTDTTSLYCTELVWRAFLSAGVDVSGGRRTHISVPPFVGDYIMPSDILCDTIFTQITTFNL
jgi:uncharacterized protein YycO